MILSKLLLLPSVLASSITIYVSPVLSSPDATAVSSLVPLAQVEYSIDQATGYLTSYTPPTGSYSSDRLLRIGFTDPKSGTWRGVVTSADSFTDKYSKKLTVHIDERGNLFHIGFATSTLKTKDEVVVEIVKKAIGPTPMLNKPIVLNAEGKLEDKVPEKSFLQKYWWAIALFILVQLLAGGGDGK